MSERTSPQAPARAPALLIGSAFLLVACGVEDPPTSTESPDSEGDAPASPDQDGDGSTEGADVPEQESGQQEDADQDDSTSEEPSEDDPVSQASLDPESIDVLVNRRNPLQPIDHEPQDLTTPDVPMVYDDQQMRQEASESLEELFTAAQEESLSLTVTTAYRDHDHQQRLYEQRLAELGQERADEFTARPGHSEHQTGLAVDLSSLNHPECYLHPCFGETPAGMWLAENAQRFGFIIRYQEGTEDITGYPYEPWHLRYLGTETAQDVHEADLTLEEYWDKPPAPEYPDRESDGEGTAED